jgi:hypothetical protein
MSALLTAFLRKNPKQQPAQTGDKRREQEDRRVADLISSGVRKGVEAALLARTGAPEPVDCMSMTGSDYAQYVAAKFGIALDPCTISPGVPRPASPHPAVVSALAERRAADLAREELARKTADVRVDATRMSPEDVREYYFHASDGQAGDVLVGPTPVQLTPRQRAKIEKRAAQRDPAAGQRRAEKELADAQEFSRSSGTPFNARKLSEAAFKLYVQKRYGGAIAEAWLSTPVGAG